MKKLSLYDLEAAKHPGKIADISGMRCGKLTVIEFVGRSHNNTYYKCLCDCGNEIIVSRNRLKTNNIEDCGCEKQKRLKKSPQKEHPRLFKLWRSMKHRCSDCKSNINYPNYAGRGIKVCDEWIHDFPAFAKWALENGYDENAEKYTCTLDRINNDGDYEPSNCRFVGYDVQSVNKRTNFNITFNGETKTLSEWEKKTGIKRATIRSRIIAGWDVKDALTIKPQYTIRSYG